MSRVIGLIEIEGETDSEFATSEASDTTLDFLFTALTATALNNACSAEHLQRSQSSRNRWAPPCPAVCHLARIEANLESLFDELDAQTAELVSRLVAARQQALAE